MPTWRTSRESLTVVVIGMLGAWAVLISLVLAENANLKDFEGNFDYD